MSYTPDQVLDQDRITKIKKLLKLRPKGLTISDISHQLKMNRNSVAKYLEILLISGHVEMRTFGAAKVFFLSQRVPMSAMLSFSSDFIVVIDSDLKIIQTNDNFLTFLALDTDTILGKEINSPQLGFFSGIPFDDLLRLRRGQKELATEIFILKGGEKFYFWTKVIPTVFDDGGIGLTVIMEDITRQKKAQQQLAESEEKFKNVTELSPFPISIIDPDGIYRYINKKFIELFGYTLDDIPTGKDWFIKAFPDISERSQALSQWLVDLNDSQIGEVRPRAFAVRCKDGATREIIFRPVSLANGDQFVVYEDITERKNAEKVQSFLAGIVASSLDAIIGKDLNGTIISWNQGAELIYGYRIDEVIGKSISLIFPPSLTDEYNHILERIRNGQGISHFRTKRVRKDGKVIDVSISVSPVRESDGRITGASTIARDITERVRFEQELHIRDTAIDAAKTGISIYDLDGTITYTNTSFAAMFGYPPTEVLIGKQLESLAHGDAGIQNTFRTIRSSAVSEGSWIGEITASRRDGKAFNAHLSATLVTDHQNVPFCVILALMDITTMKRIESELSINRQRLQEIIEFLPDPTLVIDPDNRVIGWNRAIEEMTGVSRQEMLGKSDYSYACPFYGEARPLLIDLIHKPEEEIRKHYPNARKVGESILTEIFVPRLNNKRGAFLWGKACSLYDQQGQYIGAIETIRDISDWKQAEESLKRVHAMLESNIPARTKELFEENQQLRERVDTLGRILSSRSDITPIAGKPGYWVFILDTAGSILYVSDPHVLSLPACDTTSLYDTPIYSLLNPDAANKVRSYIESKESINSFHYPSTITLLGTSQTAEIEIRSIKGRNRELLGYILSFTSISE